VTTIPKPTTLTFFRELLSSSRELSGSTSTSHFSQSAIHSLWVSFSIASDSLAALDSPHSTVQPERVDRLFSAVMNDLDDMIISLVVEHLVQLHCLPIVRRPDEDGDNSCDKNG
jgi:hypothetical protein